VPVPTRYEKHNERPPEIRELTLHLTVEAASGAIDLDLDRLTEVLQPASHVPYATAHVFPMSTPRFDDAPEAVRPQSTGAPLGLYLHIPFCRYACNFCFYVKQIGAQRDEMERYVNVLERELEWIAADTPLTQLFVGGGTPTALPPDLFDRVLAAAFRRLDRSRESVHTVECSPETLTPDHLRVLADHRVGRISLGIQTLNDEILGRIHRRHTPQEALEACAQLVASGRMVNVDLIYGLPGQTEESFRRDFETIAGLGVHCVNAYSLRVNESTPVLGLLSADERMELTRLVRWRALVERTAVELGYEQTHWQRFMLPGSDFVLDLTSDHLFGAGVSARSFLDGVVYRNHTGIKKYMQRIDAGRSPVEQIFTLNEEHRRTHFITRTLGSGKPLLRDVYQQKFGSRFDDDYAPILGRLFDADLLVDEDDGLTMTPSGRLVYDLVTLAFYPRELQVWLEQRHAAGIARRSRN
jgi:oxygen-independent coproporphyrinogen-3 oxidase